MGWLQWFQAALAVLNTLAGIFHGAQAAKNNASKL